MMKIGDLIARAGKAINDTNERGFGKPKIALRMPGKWERDGQTKRLVPQGRCPRGTIVGAQFDGTVIALFDAVDVLAWCISVSGVDYTIEAVDPVEESE